MIENVKKGAVRVKNELLEIWGLALQKPQAIRAVECAIRFILAFLLSCAEIFGGYAPFGVAMVAASGAGVFGGFALAGTIMGSVMFGGFSWAVKYIAMGVLVYAAAFVFCDTKMYKKDWFMPASAVFMAFCTGFVYAADAGWNISATVFFLTETVLVGGSAYFYKIALSPWKASGGGIETRHTVSVLILISTALVALSGISLFAGISPGRLMAQLVVMLAAYKGGLGTGSTAGIAVGLAMDAARGGAPFFSMAYAFSGLMSGVFSKHGKLMFVISFVLANAVAVLWTYDSVLYTGILYETFISSVIFMVLPAGAIARLGSVFSGEGNSLGDLRAREHSRNKVEQVSLAFYDLYETVKYATQIKNNDNDIATVFDKAAEDTCLKCALARGCWQREYVTTLNAMNDAAPKMLERGRLLAEDFPSHFSEKCLNLKGFTEAVNEELRALLYRRQYRSRLRENQSAVYSQYSDLAAILSNVAEELGADMGFEPTVEKRLQKYLRSLDIDADTAIFRDSSGRLHAEIEGGSLSALQRDENRLDKLSAVVGLRLCEAGQDTVRDRNRLKLLEAEPLAASVGIASVRKKGQPVSGDCGTYFKTDEGLICVILSDGMGSGPEAKKESSAAVRILERFLKAGVDPIAAIRLLNSVMLLKSNETPGCATVDLMCVNLFTGEARIFKYGAAPSYIKKGKTIKKIAGESLAAGLSVGDKSSPDLARIRLEPGNFVIIASDGVITEDSDEWIKELSADYDGHDTKEFSRLILERAMGKNNCEDDMTVLAVHVEERK